VTPASPLLINGRFLTQGMTGVQRFATEITRAADALAGEGLWPAATRVLVPPGAPAPGYRHLAVLGVRGTGRGGQAWEQIDLPRAARGSAGGMLLNLGNTAPVLLGWRQAVVIHDAGVFDTPESYSLAFRAWYRLLHRALAGAGRCCSPSRTSRAGGSRITCASTRRGSAWCTRAASTSCARPPTPPCWRGTGWHRAASPWSSAPRRRTRTSRRWRRRPGCSPAVGMALAIAGGGAAAGPFRAAADGGTTGAGVRMLGRVSDAELRALYEAALCLVFPSRYEGFGLPPIEALCCGCPVVAARSGAVPRSAARRRPCGSTPRGPRRPAQAIARLIEEPGLRGRLVAAAGPRRALLLARAALRCWSWSGPAPPLARTRAGDGKRRPDEGRPRPRMARHLCGVRAGAGAAAGDLARGRSLRGLRPPAGDQRHFLKGKVPRTSFVQRLPFARRRFRWYLGLMPLASSSTTSRATTWSSPRTTRSPRAC
jgi:hypothetical protein